MLKQNRLEIEELLLKEKKILECINSLKNLKEIESKKELPFVTHLKECYGSFLPQNSFSLEETVINMKKLDDIYNDVTWTEKYSFGFIISQQNLKNKVFLPEKFFISNKTENLKSYIFPTSDYAILYTDQKEEYSKSIKRLLDWIKNNNLVITGDLIIEDPSTYRFSEKYNSFFKIFRIPVKKS